MTPGETPLYEKGKTYKPFVLFASSKEPWYINVQMKGGACFKAKFARDLSPVATVAGMC